MCEHLTDVCCEYGGLVDFRLKEIIHPDNDFDFQITTLSESQLFAITHHLKKGMQEIDDSYKGGLLEYLKNGIDCGCGTVYLVEDKSYALSNVGL